MYSGSFYWYNNTSNSNMHLIWFAYANPCICIAVYSLPTSRLRQSCVSHAYTEMNMYFFTRTCISCTCRTVQEQQIEDSNASIRTFHGKHLLNVHWILLSIVTHLLTLGPRKMRSSCMRRKDRIIWIGKVLLRDGCNRNRQKE